MTLAEPIEVQLTDAAFGGEAIGHLPDGRVVFVPRALPGETALVHIQQERRDFARAELASVEQAAAGRVEAPCPYFTVGRRFGELCFTLRGSHRLLRIEHCWIVHPRINEVVEIVQGRLSSAGRRIHQVSIRVGANTGQLMLAPLLPEVPEVESGQPFLEEELLGRRFRLEPPSFFQVNTRREVRSLPAALTRPWLPLPADGLSMAELLVLLVLDRLQPEPDWSLVDAYSGVGTFALLLAPLVREVIGIEEARSAVRDAVHNGQDLPNARFIQGKTEAVLPALEQRPDGVILDPARVGCHPDVLQALLSLRPHRLVYVSCDPSTLVRDLRILVDGGYTLHEVQPLDMFPQTYHIESVATLSI
ncbi:MAG: TRAM domain-containing protein [Chloroflexi bacterium]|nr:TRAM domain-containing protein [Chloroflexota bacterium]